ncbi:unnamed protein product [Dibothriocephalus latus]|uniref:Uncharacterized protein n=1 Tax=Dibothriocephalus latus TaxID=60516 RepID=A0A3P7MAH1_DIBLA|nr:unnamed protein product [Dibothriocephalus latus]
MANFGLTLLLSLGIAATYINAEGYVLTKEDTRIIEEESGCAELTTVVPSDFTLTIADTNGEVCRNYEPVTCGAIMQSSISSLLHVLVAHLGITVKDILKLCLFREDIDEHTVGFTANVDGTTGERYSFVFCQISGDGVEYIIDWEGEGMCRLFLLHHTNLFNQHRQLYANVLKSPPYTKSAKA